MTMAYYQFLNGEVAEFDFEPSGAAKKISAKAGKAAIAEQAKTKLRKIFPPGSTVYTILKHRSSNGMSRRIDVVAKDESGPRNVTWLVAQAEGYRTSKDGSLVVGGCGMNMGFHVAYSLSSALWRGDFKCVGKDCSSNDHSNGDKNYSPHEHSDGGYALRHSWL